MEITQIFSAEPKSIWHVLSDPGACFYIPSYQRGYSWNNTNIERLFEDIGHGMRLLLENEDVITFIGSFITIHDTKYETVEPHLKGQMPSKVLLIIDGQQRLTTILLLLTVLHEEVKNRSRKFKNKDDEALKWLFQKCLELSANLQQTYTQDQNWGDGDYQWYPRMIRSIDDSWSRESNAKYTSPIASYLHRYSIHAHNDVKQPYDHISDGNQEFMGNHKTLINNHKLIRKNLKAIAKENFENDGEIVKTSEFIDNTQFQDILLKSEFPEHVKEKIKENEYNTPFTELLRLVLLAKFVLERVAVTMVTAKNEHYAFDMFEALNTTGTLLTAVETFKPLVIKAEGTENYKDSLSHVSFKDIDHYLDKFDGEKKQTATNDVLIPFALAETGFQLSKRLNDQRRYLRKKFDNLESIEKQREFVRHLSHTAIFVENVWSKKQKPIKFPGRTEVNDDLVLMCLDVLRQAKHDITIAPIVRFFSKIQTSDEDSDLSAVNEFIDAVKSMIAFFVLWRGSRRNTDGIDKHYRDLMNVGIQEIDIPPLARLNGLVSTPNSENLSIALKHILETKGKISCKEDWVQLAQKMPIHKINFSLARILLLAATHDTEPDSSSGLLKPAKKDYLNLLCQEQWKNLTVEHVAPKTKNDGWDSQLYDDEDTIHRLGNLTLLPQRENTSLGNRPWETKKLIYQILSSSDPESLQKLLKEAKIKGLELSQDTQEILSNAKYLPHAKAVGMYNHEWDLGIARSKNLAELAWDRLSPWLGYK